MTTPKWTNVEDVAEGLEIETVGRRVMVYPAALRRALRQAMAHGIRHGGGPYPEELAVAVEAGEVEP